MEVFAVLSQHCGTGHANVSDENDLKKWVEAKDELYGSFSRLMASCKTALNDMNSAKAAFKADELEKAKTMAEREKQEKRKGSQQEKRGRPQKKGRKDVRPALLTIEVLGGPGDQDHVPVLQAPIAAERFRKPFMMTSQMWLQDLLARDKGASAIVQEFTKVFDDSSIKITEGRAQQRVRDKLVGKVLLDAMCGALGCVCVRSPCFVAAGKTTEQIDS